MGAGGDGGQRKGWSETAEREGSLPAQRNLGSDGSLFLVSSYTDTSVLAHTPKGTLGEGIYSLFLDAKTGRLTRLATTTLGPNPAFILKHPSLDTVFYATTECIASEGDLLTLELQQSGEFKVLGRQSAVRRVSLYIGTEGCSIEGVVCASNPRRYLPSRPVGQLSGIKLTVGRDALIFIGTRR